jgi:DNA-binding protein HU-beta
MRRDSGSGRVGSERHDRTVRETPKRSALNPHTGEKVAVKAGATVRFKASPVMKAEVLAGLKKTKRKVTKKA